MYTSRIGQRLLQIWILWILFHKLQISIVAIELTALNRLCWRSSASFFNSACWSFVIHQHVAKAFGSDDAAYLVTRSSQHCLVDRVYLLVFWSISRFFSAHSNTWIKSIKMNSTIKTNQSLSPLPAQNDAAENAVRHEPTRRRPTGRFREWQPGRNKSPLGETAGQKVFVAKKGRPGRPRA